MTYCATHQTMILIRSNKSQTKSQIRIRSLHLKLESYIGSYFDHWPFGHESHKTFYLVKPHYNHSVSRRKLVKGVLGAIFYSDLFLKIG